MAPRSALQVTAAAVAAASVSTACLHTEQAASPSTPAAAALPEPTPVQSAEHASDGVSAVAIDGGRLQHELLAIDPQARAYRVLLPGAYVTDGDEFVSRVRICVDENGNVSHVDVIAPSIAAVDEQLPEVIARWHYRPYVIEGHATAFCYPMNYRVTY